ncbi:MAG: hypothetical protein ACREPM_25390, partial [Gemmatimonadaceae bacterium]
MSTRRSWRLLLGLWGTYWALLVVFALGPLALAVLRATSGPANDKSSVNVNFDGKLSVTVIEQGRTTYSAAVHFIAIAL